MPSYVRAGIRKCARIRALSIGIVLCGSVTVDFWHTGMVARFPTLIGAVMLVIAGLLLFITGIILDVMAKNDRKAFIIDANQFAMMRRQK